jgi:outer membrane protein assembly factor BamB
MFVSNGDDTEPPMEFLPANANAHGLIVVDNAAYAATSEGCGGAANALWAVDLVSKQLATWKPEGSGIAGSLGPAFGPDGTLYVATADGELVHLEAKTLKPKDSYSSGKPGFASTPVIFAYKDKTLIAADGKDGRMHLLDSAALAKPLSVTAKASNTPDSVPVALSSWQDSDGTRWILAPVAGPVAPDAGFTATSGTVTNGAVVAWKVVDQNGAPTLQPGWVSRDMVSPLTPMVINGVVFALSSGEFRSSDNKLTAAERIKRSSPAVLYALDSATGKEVWNSGKTIASFVHGGALSGGGTQVYLETYDGNLYAFGFYIEH